ncbi:MAG: peptidoglycan-binding protein [Pseudomonadota bacterium]
MAKKIIPLIAGLGFAGAAAAFIWFAFKRQTESASPEEECLRKGGTWDAATRTCIEIVPGPPEETPPGQPPVTPPGQVPAAPGAPYKVSSRAVSPTSAELTIAWNPVPGAVYYKVWHKVAALPVGTANRPQFTATGLYPDAPWTVAIEACNEAGGCSGKGPFATLYTAYYEYGCRPPYPLLRVGSAGDCVRFAQARLTAHGFSPGAIDGAFGSKTYSATVAFQRARGLAQDGVIGPLTWAELVKSRWPA